MAILNSFIFDTSKGETPESIARKRAIAAQIMGQMAPRSAKNVGEGVGNALASLGQGIVANVMNRRADKADAAGQEGAQNWFRDNIINALTNGGTIDTSGGGFSGAPVGAVERAPLGPDQRIGQSFDVAGGGVNPQIATGIVETAQALGIDPVDLATTISYETGGTFDPTKSGPTTKWGTHRGLIQFGEPQAKQFGVNWDDPVGSQLGANGAVANYLRSRGVKPGMGLLDIYSTINAGSPGLYNRSDAVAGGAPGTVQDKVATQMAGHRAKAQALLSPYLTAYAPTEAPQAGAMAAAPFASAGMPTAPIQSQTVPTDGGRLPNTMDDPRNQLTLDYAPAQGGDYVDPLMSPRQNPNGIVDLGQGSPGEKRRGPDGQMYQYVETSGMAGASGGWGWIRVADDGRAGGLTGQVGPNDPGIWGGGMDPNDPSTIPSMAGGTRDILPAGTPGQFPEAPQLMPQGEPNQAAQAGGILNIPPQLILQGLSNPFLPKEQKAFLQNVLEMQMQAQDPYRQAQIAKMQREASGPAELGLTPQYGVDKDGNPVLIQVGKDGRAVQTKMPEGVQLSKEPIKFDAGTHFVLLDPITRQPVGQIPKENYQEAFDKGAGGAAGKAQGEAAANLPTELATAQQALGELDALIGHEGLAEIAGPIDQYRPSWTMSDKGRDALARYNQAKGRAFLQAFGMLKGGGQITEIEGLKAEQAMARMDRAQSETEFKQALQDFRDAVSAGMEKMQQRAGVPATIAPEPKATKRLRYNPATGELE